MQVHHRIGTYLLILISSIAFGQLREPVDIDSPFTPSPGFSGSILNPNRLTMNHSVTFMASSGGGTSSSVGLYSNYINYRISDKMWINGGLHLISPMSNSNPYANNEMDFNYDIQLNYRFTENSMFQLRLARINTPLLYDRYRFGW